MGSRHDDIRDQPVIDNDAVVGLNFIRSKSAYFFRRYFRNGLRSHVMEVLRSSDVKKETRGVLVDGIRQFPRAIPLKMLRIFRRRFLSFAEVLNEIKRVKIIERYLTPQQMARSDEFIVGYHLSGREEILLCGLQEYVSGEAVDPWRIGPLESLSKIVPLAGGDFGRFMNRVSVNLGAFVSGIKKMILEAEHIPDLAGEGNILLTSTGDIKLVDINNISKIVKSRDIYRDDNGYPVCDKSVEVLALLEKCLLNGESDVKDPIYGFFLDPERTARVREVTQAFHQTLQNGMHGD